MSIFARLGATVTPGAPLSQPKPPRTRHVDFCPPRSDSGERCHPVMPSFDDDRLAPLAGIELRYVLTMYLFQRCPTTVARLVDAITWQDFDIAGRPSKSLSDALRWEIRSRRVRRLRRGLYGPASMPRATEYRIHQRVLALRAETGRLSLPMRAKRRAPGC